MSNKTMLGDASGRGAVDGFRVTCPAMQHPYTEAEIDAVVKVMREACGQTQGKYMVEFEQAFCAFTGAKHAFADNNRTRALTMPATFCYIQPGDEVIIPAYTFCASAIPFGDLGAKIVWADISPDTWTIDPDDIARKITPKTKAVVCVHLLGMPCDMKRIVPIARAHGLKVVEDCAQALDCRIDGQHVGTFGDFGCFSFHSAKTMTTLGEGGMFVCADDADAAAAPGIRHNGCCAYPADRARYWSPAMSCVDSFLDDRWPQNFCIGEAQCALGTEELKSVIANNNTLIEQDRKIREKLAGLPEISFSRCPENSRYVVHQYIMHYDGSACGKTRDDLLDLMTKKYGIRCIVQYYPLYRYPLFQRKGCGEFDCPVLDKWWDGSFSFPWWCGMDDAVIDTLCSSLISAVEELRG